MNSEDYCSYKLSKALKACGFDEPCGSYYDKACASDDEYWHTKREEIYNWNGLGSDCQISAPILWQAQKWLREKKELCVTVYAQPYNGLPYYTGYILFEGDEKEVLDQDGHWYDDYEKCLSETISAALELIKKGE